MRLCVGICNEGIGDKTYTITAKSSVRPQCLVEEEAITFEPFSVPLLESHVPSICMYIHMYKGRCPYVRTCVHRKTLNMPQSVSQNVGLLSFLAS